MSTSTSDLLSIDDAAPLIGVKPRTLRDMCARRKIRFMRVGPGRGLYRFRRDWLLEYLASCEIEPVSDVEAPVSALLRRSTAIRPQSATPPKAKPKTLEKALAKLGTREVAK